MLKFKAKNAHELEIELTERTNEIAVETVKGIIKALENDVDVVLLGIIPAVNMDISVKRGGFLSALERNIEKCSDADEYELCEEALLWIKKLQS